MKIKINIIAISCFMSMVFLTGCYVEPSYRWSYNYENRSGHYVVIPQKTVSNEFITLNDGETVSLTPIWRSVDTARPFGEAESVSIIFDGDRVLTFSLEDEAVDNILIPWLYDYNSESKSRSRIYYTFLYTFTPEMYERAVPIEEAE